MLTPLNVVISPLLLTTLSFGGVVSTPDDNTTILPSGTLTFPFVSIIGLSPLSFGVTTLPPGVIIECSFTWSVTIVPFANITLPPVGNVTFPNWSICGACPFNPGLTSTSSAVPSWPSSPATLTVPSCSVTTWFFDLAFISWTNKFSSLTSAKDVVVNPRLLIVIAPVNTKRLAFFIISPFSSFFLQYSTFFLNFNSK